MKYLLKQSTEKKSRKKTPQSKPIPGREKEMTRNAAGGVTFTADSFSRLERFLILGSEGGTYYVSEHDLTKQNIDNVRACIASDGHRAVDMIAGISAAGRAPKNDPAIYALALAASYGADADIRDYALAMLPKVCRTGTHLFTFAAFIDQMRGWGPALRKAVAAWYLEKPADKLAYQLLKYQQRNGWSNYDLLRLSHPKPITDAEKFLFQWVAGKKPEIPRLPALAMVHAFEAAKKADEKELIRLIKAYGLTREMIPTEHQRSVKVWEALLENMPMTAMIRTLGRMGSVGLLKPLSDASILVRERLADIERLRRARVHPIQLLIALLTYQMGHGQRGSLSWPVDKQIEDALEAAFYTSFSLVEPTGQRFYLGIDVSGSMAYGQVVGVPGMSANMGAAAMAMLIARTEPNHFIGGFSTRFIDLKISAHDKLVDAMRKSQRAFGGTDCAVAINHALTNRYPVDCFVVISDGETWAGDTHASQMLVEYRQRTGRDTKLVVVNMVANRTSLCDPLDRGSLDVVGFDASVPAIINEFIGAASTAAVVGRKRRVESDDEAETQPSPEDESAE